MRSDMGTRFLSRSCGAGLVLGLAGGEVLDARLGGGPVLFLDGGPDLVSVHGDLGRRLDAEPDGRAGDLEDGDRDVVPEADALSRLARDDEHVWRFLPGIRPPRPGSARSTALPARRSAPPPRTEAAEQRTRLRR